MRDSINVIASVAKQSTLSFFSRQDGLLRGACHRAALRDDPLARNEGLEPSCLGCLKIESSLVVPAKVGTRNHPRIVSGRSRTAYPYAKALRMCPCVRIDDE